MGQDQAGTGQGDVKMKKAIIFLAAIMASPACLSSGGEDTKLDPVYINLTDKDSLRNGARLFVNFCLSCHSAAYMRYNRMARDLEIPDEVVKEQMLFAGDKLGDLMKTTMPVADAKKWFGVAPPDLTLVARVRKPEWIYTYLRGFHMDPKSHSGWNNVVFHNVAMPHILYELEGSKVLSGTDEHGRPKFTYVKRGTLTKEQYDAAVRDLTNFLVYLAEPAKLHRYSIGVYVIAFLLVLLLFSIALKKEYWRDVH